MLRKILIPSKFLATWDTFRCMDPAFRNVLFTAFLNQDNYSGIMKISRKGFYSLMNVTPEAGKDIFEAFMKQFPDVLAFDEETSELAILFFPNTNLQEMRDRQIPVLQKDLKDVQSTKLLSMMVKMNHRNNVQHHLSRLQQLTADKRHQETFEKSITSEDVVSPIGDIDFQVVAPNLNLNPNLNPNNEVNMSISESEFDGPKSEFELGLEEEIQRLNRKAKDMISAVDGMATDELRAAYLKTLSKSEYQDWIKYENFAKYGPKKERLFNELKKSERWAAFLIIPAVDEFISLSGKTRTSYHAAKDYFMHWIRKGYSLEDFLAVIRYKINEFKGTDNAKYIKLDTFLRYGNGGKFLTNLDAAMNWMEEQDEEEDKFKVEDHPNLRLSDREKMTYNRYKTWIENNYPALWSKKLFMTVEQYFSISRDENLTGRMIITDKARQMIRDRSHGEAEKFKGSAHAAYKKQLQDFISQTSS